MEGRKLYDDRFTKKIQHTIDTNPDIEYLEDFESYLYSIKGIECISSRQSYIKIAVNFCRFINKVDPAEFKLTDFSKYIRSLEKKSDSYRILNHAALKAFSQFLFDMEDNGYEQDYMANVKSPKKRKNSKREERRENNYLNDEELQEYINNLNEEKKYARIHYPNKYFFTLRDVAMVMLMLSTGVRASAVQNIDLDDVSLENRTVKVTEKENYTVEIPISREMANVLKEWIDARKLVLEGYPEVESLFISNRRKPICYNMVANIVNKYGINTKNVKPHTLRHTFGTNAYVDSGYDIVAVQKQMNHASVSTTTLYIQGKDTKARQLINATAKRYF